MEENKKPTTFFNLAVLSVVAFVGIFLIVMQYANTADSSGLISCPGGNCFIPKPLIQKPILSVDISKDLKHKLCVDMCANKKGKCMKDAYDVWLECMSHAATDTCQPPYERAKIECAKAESVCISGCAK